MRRRKPDHYISCPNCRQMLRVRYYISGFEQIQWSDDFCGTSPKAFCKLSACPTCNQPFWTHDLEPLRNEVVPTIRDNSLVSAIRAFTSWLHAGVDMLDEKSISDSDVAIIKPASNHQKIAALVDSSLSDDRVLYLRTLLWHSGNHPQRGIPSDPNDTIPDSFRLANLQWLLKHYEAKENDDRDIVLEAELLREQGLFRAAIKRLEPAVLCGSTRAVVILREALANNTKVCVVRESNSVVVI